MAILSKIRRWYFRDKLSIREIARRTGFSRNTVRRYLRTEIAEPLYPQRQTPSKLDAFTDKLTQWLTDAARASRKQRRSVKQMHADLCALGFDGSYDRVAVFAREWRRQQLESTHGASKHTYIPLQFSPGEAFQFDWSEDWAVIAGERIKLQVAHCKLCYSRAFFVRAYPLQTHEMLFDAHHHAFTAWGGIPQRGIYDNMRTAVDKVGRGKQRTDNARFKAMTSHYLFEAEFCNPASGWEKGQVEKNVQDATKKPYYTDENGNKVEYDETYYINGEEILLPQLTQEQVDRIVSFVESVNKRGYYNEAISNIISEEAGAYFSGQKSARDVAGVIQSRVQVYVNENR